MSSEQLVKSTGNGASGWM